MFSAEPVSYNSLLDLRFSVRFFWNDVFCCIWGTFKTDVNCEVLVIHVMIKWYFCAKPEWLWSVIKVLMQHQSHITANGKNNLKMKMCHHRRLHQPSYLYFGVYETLCLLLDALSSLFAVRQWCHSCLVSYPSVEEMRGPDGGGIRPARDNISDGRLGSY